MSGLRALIYCEESLLNLSESVLTVYAKKAGNDYS